MAGNDGNTGLSPEQAWRSLEKASGVTYESGDRLLFERGAVFNGVLELKASGSEAKPVVVDGYGSGAAPVIDAKGRVAGLAMVGCGYVEVNNLEITSDGGDPIEPQAAFRRFGVHVAVGDRQFKHVVLRGLHIHDIFAAKENENQAGFGIFVESPAGGKLSGFTIENCRIERTAATGIMIRGGRGAGYALSDVKILNNELTDIGGPGMNPMSVTNLLVRGNVVDRSGSTAEFAHAGAGKLHLALGQRRGADREEYFQRCAASTIRAAHTSTSTAATS